MKQYYLITLLAFFILILLVSFLQGAFARLQGGITLIVVPDPAPRYSGIRYFSFHNMKFRIVSMNSHRSSTFPHFGISPFPIQGKVGIKFDNNQDGKTITQVFLKHGYKTVQKETEGLAFLYQQIAAVTMRSV